MAFIATYDMSFYAAFGVAFVTTDSRAVSKTFVATYLSACYFSDRSAINATNYSTHRFPVVSTVVRTNFESIISTEFTTYINSNFETFGTPIKSTFTATVVSAV